MQNGLMVCACYFSPNSTKESFKVYLGSIRSSIVEQKPRNLIVVGDFNAKSLRWCSEVNARGNICVEWLEAKCNQDDSSSYRPICLINCIDKLYERLINKRLNREL